MKRPARHYAFGPYVLDGLRGVLWDGTTAVGLTPRVFALLATLVERHGEVLEKDEIIRLVWAGAIVEENNLARHVSTLRKALHERPGQRDYIATIPGVGYRFVAEVVELEKLPPELSHAPVKRPDASGAPPQTAPGLPDEPPAPLTARADHATVLAAPTEAPTATLTDVSAGTLAAPGTAASAPSAPALPGSRPAPARPWLAAAATLLVVAAAGSAASRLWFAPARPVQRMLAEVTYGPGLQREPAWSPDGRLLAFTSDRRGNSDIWIQDLANGTMRALTTGAEQESQPDWSPDGLRLAFRSERQGGGLYEIPITGGPERQLASFGSRPRWSPNGRQILFSSAAPTTGSGLKMFLVTRDDGAPRPVRHEALDNFNILGAAWHPDGRVSFWGQEGRGGSREFLTIALDTGAVQRSEIGPLIRAALSRDALELTSFAWAPSGHYLYFEGESRAVRNLWRVAVNPATLAWLDEPERLTTGPGSDGDAAVSPDGTRLAFGVASGRSVLWSFPFDPAAARVTGAGTALTTGDPPERGADVWSDGKRMVYLASRNDRQELWERSQDAEPQLLLATTDSTSSPPRWSPDGTRIAYHRRPNRPGSLSDGTLAVFTVGGGVRREQLTPGVGEVVPSDWSADSQLLLARCRLRSEDRSGTCIMPVSGSRADVRLVSSSDRLDMMQQRFSPDQRWISFIAVPTGDQSLSTIYVMPSTGGAWTPVTDGTAYDDKPRWAPDGQTLYFISNREGRGDVWARHFDSRTGQPVGQAFRVAGFDLGRQTITPNIGQLTLSITKTRMVLPLYDATGQIWLLDRVDR